MQVDKEMGLSHEDFFRALPRALNGIEHSVQSDRVIVREGERSVTLELAPQTSRVLGAMRLPTTRVKLTFSGYNSRQAADFLAAFDLHFRRGGG